MVIGGRTFAKRALRFLRPMVRWAAGVPVLGPRLRRLGERLLPPGQTEPMRVTRGIARGLVLELNPGTSAAFRQGEVEPEVTDAIQRFAHPGAVFYDLGANMGYFSRLIPR
jgi:hypothetical protein